MSAAGVRLLGCALLTAAGFLLGRGRVQALRRRMLLLRSLCASLGAMAEELTLLRTPLPDIFALLRDRPFFCLLDAGFGTEGTAALWRRAADSLPLAPEERALLASLSAVVGRYGAAEQASELRRVRAALAERADALEAELGGRARSLPGLGASFGAMLAVLLL